MSGAKCPDSSTDKPDSSVTNNKLISNDHNNVDTILNSSGIIPSGPVDSPSTKDVFPDSELPLCDVEFPIQFQSDAAPGAARVRWCVTGGVKNVFVQDELS